jgi:predicted DNA-binding protein
MNTAKLSRATFVLGRETHEELAFMARRMGVTRSSLVRELLEEPVALMAKWMREVPAEVRPEDVARLERMVGHDVTELLERKTRDLEAGHG